MPAPLARLLTRCEVHTTDQEGWSTLVNGKLLEAAEQAGYDVLLTGDQRIKHQQNLANRKLAIVVLSTNAWPVIRKSPQPVIDAVDAAAPGSYTEVTLPRPPLIRRRYP